MFVPVYEAGTNGINFTQPFIVPTYNFTHEPVMNMLTITLWMKIFM